MAFASEKVLQRAAKPAFCRRCFLFDGKRISGATFERGGIQADGDALRTMVWERAWQQLPQFRLVHRLLTFGTGVTALTDAALRVVVVYRFPLDRAARLANVPHIAAWAVLIAIWGIFGRWAAF